MTENTRHETPDVAELRRLAEACPMPYILSADAAFIAAASPDVVLGLLDRLAHMTEARDNARAEVERLSAAVRRVRELHRESNGSLAALYPNPICECGKDYPCQTARALAEVERLTARVERVRALADLIDRHTEFERDPVDFRDASHGGSWDDVADRIRRALDEEPQP